MFIFAVVDQINKTDMTMKKLFLIFAVVSMVLAGCSEEVENPNNPAEEPEAKEPFENAVVVPVPELSPSEQTAADCQRAFGIKFLKTANKNYTGRTMLVSPLSASLLVSMIANTVDDDLSTRISRVLGTEDVAALNTLSAKYMEWLPGIDKDVTVNIANSVWYSNRYTLNPSFAAVASGSYGSELYGRDFSKSSAVTDEINSWTSRNTRGMIKHIIDILPPFAVYVNTLYFRGYWHNQFHDVFTEPFSFHGQSGTYSVDMMGQNEYFNYYADDAGTVVELPFGEKSECSMLLLLPAENTDIDAFIASDNFDRLVSAGRTAQDVIIRLPKFKIMPDDEIEITGILEALGMTGIGDFRKSKVFNETLEGRLDICQKTALSLDEDGVEAAAASYMGFGSTGEELPEPKRVTFDRPFAFIIMENNTGLSLFAGKVADLR